LFFVGFLLLPFTYAATVSFVQQLNARDDWSRMDLTTWWFIGGFVLWRTSKDAEEQLSKRLHDEARQAIEQEYRRLLYVAMTRARDRLYVCGFEGKKGRSQDCWFDMIERGLGDSAYRPT